MSSCFNNTSISLRVNGCSNIKPDLCGVYGHKRLLPIVLESSIQEKQGNLARNEMKKSKQNHELSIL